MKRKRLTQVFPFLLPIRKWKWQRKKRLRLPMRFWAYIPPLNVLCPSNVPPKISPKTANLLMSEGHT